MSQTSECKSRPFFRFLKSLLCNWIWWPNYCQLGLKLRYFALSLIRNVLIILPYGLDAIKGNSVFKDDDADIKFRPKFNQFRSALKNLSYLICKKKVGLNFFLLFLLVWKKSPNGILWFLIQLFNLLITRMFGAIEKLFCMVSRRLPHENWCHAAYLEALWRIDQAQGILEISDDATARSAQCSLPPESREGRWYYPQCPGNS